MINFFKPPTIAMMVSRELDMAERDLLKCENELENHQSHKDLLTLRIFRLKTKLAAEKAVSKLENEVKE